MSTRFYDTDLTDAAWPGLPRFCRRRDQAGDREPPTFVPSSTLIFYHLRTGCQWRMLPREFPPVARSTITFRLGKAPGCGSIYIACSTSRPVVMPDGQLVHRW